MLVPKCIYPKSSFCEMYPTCVSSLEALRGQGIFIISPSFMNDPKFT